MTNAMIDSKYKNIENRQVIIERHCIVGTNSTILPGSKLNEGVAIDAHSLVNRELFNLERNFLMEMERRINE